MQRLTTTGWFVTAASRLNAGRALSFDVLAGGLQHLRVDLLATELHLAATSPMITFRVIAQDHTLALSAWE